MSYRYRRRLQASDDQAASHNLTTDACFVPGNISAVQYELTHHRLNQTYAKVLSFKCFVTKLWR